MVLLVGQNATECVRQEEEEEEEVQVSSPFASSQTHVRRERKGSANAEVCRKDNNDYDNDGEEASHEMELHFTQIQVQRTNHEMYLRIL